jgi:hypothetical protein
MRQRRRTRRAAALDVAELPASASATQPDVVGNGRLMAIESTVFALAIVVYFYLRSHVERWPMSTPPPDAALGHAQHRDPRRQRLAEPPRQARRRAARPARRAGLADGLPRVALVFLVVRGSSSSALNVPLGQRRLRLDRLDC